MNKFLQLALVIAITCNIAIAQRAQIITEAVTPHSLGSLGLTTNSVSTGLDIVPNQTYVYLSAHNIGNSDTIQTATFTFLSKPTGSTTELTVFGSTWVYFLPDIKGAYTIELQITTAAGTHDTTKTIYAANFVGVGNFEGVFAQYPNCMSCHGSTPEFIEIFNRWKESGHANIFKREMTNVAGHYGPSCIKCHTIGTDHNVTAANNGFDDLAAQLGWSWVGPATPGKWDSLKTMFPGLVNHATIGCENCHGPGGEHSLGANPDKIQISYKSGVCASCHDEPWRHNKYSEFENSLHSESLWSGSFSQGASSQNNNLQNCIRCHDAKGYVNFTKGLTTNTTGMVEAQHLKISCATCHDPHGNNNVASLRDVPAGSDTLGNGFQYTVGGTGKVCMNCHKARRDGDSYVLTNVSSSHWGPHHSVQADNLLGQNCVDFGVPFLSGNHQYATQDACVTCHMVATVDTGNVNRDKVGGHTWSLHNEETGFDYTKACVGCHGEKESFQSFMALIDYDTDGEIESIRDEIAGLERLLRIWLPPVGIDSISYQLIGQNNILEEKKAYWNYMMISYDGSGGMHNPKYAIDVLSKSIMALGGVIPVQLTSFNAEVEGKAVNLTWETATETNNRGFNIERKYGDSWGTVGFVEGHGSTVEVQKYTFKDDISNATGKTISYRLKQIDFDGSYEYSREIEVSIVNSPQTYSLSQNYPNPFNPSTIIAYTLPVESKVKVVIYNIAGEVVRELVNTVQGAGNYEAAFSTSMVNISSGIYFYSIEATALDGSNSFRQTKKMVLLK